MRKRRLRRKEEVSDEVSEKVERKIIGGLRVRQKPEVVRLKDPP